MFLVLHRFLGTKRSMYISFGLIVFKELVDVFMKSRLDYIRAPKVDLLYDVIAGTTGVLLAYWIVRRKRRKKPSTRKKSKTGWKS